MIVARKEVIQIDRIQEMEAASDSEIFALAELKLWRAIMRLNRKIREEGEEVVGPYELEPFEPLASKGIHARVAWVSVPVRVREMVTT